MLSPEVMSWVSMVIASPVHLTLMVAILSLLHSFRRQWRTLDVFLTAFFTQQLLSGLVAFLVAVLRLMKAGPPEVCGLLTWSLTSLRALGASAVTSMAADRLMTIKWPYKYRYAVRRSQIRYHIGVLTIVAVLIGTAALFSTGSDSPANAEKFCTFLPYKLNTKLSVFTLSVHGLLVLVTVFAFVGVQICLCRQPTLKYCPSDFSPLSHSVSSASASSGSYRSAAGSQRSVVHPPYPGHRRARQRKPAHRIVDDFRWPTVSFVVLVSSLINHIPYLVLLILGTFLPAYLPPWSMENATLWMSLAEGLLIGPVLMCLDPPIRTALTRSCHRKQQPDYSEAGETVFRRRIAGLQSPLAAGLPFSPGSRFTSPQGTTSTNTGRSCSVKSGALTVVSLGGKPFFISTSHLDGGPAFETRSPHFPPAPLSRSVSLDSVIKPPQDEPLYATLSETLERSNSATTIANDDFEFHSTPRFAGRRTEAEVAPPIRRAAAAPAPPTWNISQVALPTPKTENGTGRNTSVVAVGNGGNSGAEHLQQGHQAINNLSAIPVPNRLDQKYLQQEDDNVNRITISQISSSVETKASIQQQIFPRKMPSENSPLNSTFVIRRGYSTNGSGSAHAQRGTRANGTTSRGKIEKDNSEQLAQSPQESLSSDGQYLGGQRVFVSGYL